MLNQRLAELREAEIVELVPGGYQLTAEGRELLAAFEPLNAWAVPWKARGR